MPNSIVHFEVIGKDPAALRHFYSEMFDWKLQEIGGPTEYATVDTGVGESQPRVGGGIGGTPEDYDGHVTFYVNVDDVEAALVKAEELGGKRTMGPMRMDGPETGPQAFDIALFSDPEGRTIGLHSLV